MSASAEVEESKSLPLRVVDTAKKIYQNITVEPLIICWLLPFLATFAAIENLNLEKGCRALVVPETGFEKDICKLFVRKDEYGIDCLSSDNATRFEDVKIDDIKSKYEDLYESIKNNLTEVYQFICDAEDPVQKKLSAINSIRNPIASIGPLIIILFAGPWSDKKKLRIPCMLVPFLGEAIGYFTLFLSAIFINGPVEIPAYAYRLIPSLTGAESLMVMGIYSYLTAVSSEENRTLRFGMFSMLMTIVPILAQSISPTLIKKFDYAELFGWMIPVHVFGLFYALYYLKEPTEPEKKEEAAYDNEGMDIELKNRNDNDIIRNSNESQVETQRKNFCSEFFDPQHAMYCFRCFFKERENGLRKIIILFMVMHFLVHGITQGETQNLFLYVRGKLNWDVDTYVYHAVFTIIAGLIGTTFAIGVLSKLFKVSDIILIILSTILSIIGRTIYVFAKTTVQFFTGSGIDLMFSLKFLAARSIISKISPAEDLSTLFAIMGIFESLAGFFFPYAYPTLYQFLLESPDYDIALMFVLSGILLFIALVTYIILWKLLRTKEKMDEENKPEDTRI